MGIAAASLLILNGCGSPPTIAAVAGGLATLFPKGSGININVTAFNHSTCNCKPCPVMAK